MLIFFIYFFLFLCGLVLCGVPFFFMCVALFFFERKRNSLN